VRSSEWLGALVDVHRGWAFGYIGAVFFVLPGVVFGGEALFSSRDKADLLQACEEDSMNCAMDEARRVDLRLE
jgi:sodium-dependent phosphate cotransporter